MEKESGKECGGKLHLNEGMSKGKQVQTTARGSSEHRPHPLESVAEPPLCQALRSMWRVQRGVWPQSRGEAVTSKQAGLSPI